jgi:hypothetical protein
MTSAALPTHIVKFAFFSDLLRGCSSLKDLALAANFLRHWPLAALKPVSHHLHTLDIGENSLRELQPLEGFKQLYGLRLAGNRLRNITEDIFAESPHIRMLNVASNLVEHIDQNAFEALKHLKVCLVASFYKRAIPHVILVDDVAGSETG